MDTKYLLLQEIEQAPELLLAVVLDFCLMQATARLALLRLRETE